MHEDFAKINHSQKQMKTGIQPDASRMLRGPWPCPRALARDLGARARPRPVQPAARGPAPDEFKKKIRGLLVIICEVVCF